MGTKLRTFDAIEDPHANLFADLCQNIFYLQGVSNGRRYVRVMLSQGHTEDAHTIYISRDEGKALKVTDYLKTAGKICLLATGILTLFFLAVHLIQFGYKKNHYFLIEEQKTLLQAPFIYRIQGINSNALPYLKHSSITGDDNAMTPPADSKHIPISSSSWGRPSSSEIVMEGIRSGSAFDSLSLTQSTPIDTPAPPVAITPSQSLLNPSDIHQSE